MADPSKKSKDADDASSTPTEQIPRRIDAPDLANKPVVKKRIASKKEQTGSQEETVTDRVQIQAVSESSTLKKEEPFPHKIFAGPLAEWIISGLCFLGGLFALFTYPVSGTILLLIGLILLPPITAFVLKRWKIRISWIWKGSIIALLAGLFVVVQLRRQQADLISHDLATQQVGGKDTLRTGFHKESPEAEDRGSQYPALGEKAVVGYFEISINRAHVDTMLGTANVYAEQAPGTGNTFVILDVTIKCIDKESRTPRIGSLLMKVEDRTYRFDKTETVSDPAWGLFFEPMNPLTSKTTKLVYKIPRDVKGEVFWEPGGNPDSVRFYCGRI